MPEPISTVSTFPMGRCDGCGKTVLTYVALDDDLSEQRLCVHCDGEVAGALKWIDAVELEASGYYIGSPPVQKSCGSGGGCGSCAVRKN